MKPPQPLRFITWNCMSCYPQYYEEVQAIEKGAPSKALQTNRTYNMTRYETIVKMLSPHLATVQTKALTAILLQEVDQELLQMIKRRVNEQHPELYVHYTTPYMTYPQRQPPPHDFAYYFVTIHHRHQRDKAPTRTKLNRKLDRCLVTVLQSCVLYNVHIPWVAPEHPEYKHRRTEQTVQALAHAVRQDQNSVVLGDLNLSCAFNCGLYQKYFSTRFYKTHVFGESYKLSPENILQRKTFKLLEHTPDDGCITHNIYNVKTTFDSLCNQKLPVNRSGWFVPKQDDTYPSDHSMVTVQCTPVFQSGQKKHSRHHKPYKPYKPHKPRSKKHRHSRKQRMKH